jgi:hypothetical protein
MIVSIPPGGSGSGGGGGTPATPGSLSLTTIETTGSFSVPAGALWVEIRNAGLVQPGDVEAEATVQGVSWSVGRVERWEAVLDTATNQFLYMPAITGNGNGSRVFITYAEV